MAQQRKYQQETINRTMTFYKADFEILEANTAYRNTVTDQVQEAIRDYIERHGLRATGPEEGKEGQ